MKRRELVKYMSQNGCRLLREGAKHSVWINDRSGATTTVPRHTEVKDFLASKICRDLEIPNIKKP